MVRAGRTTINARAACAALAASLVVAVTAPQPGAAQPAAPADAPATGGGTIIGRIELADAGVPLGGVEVVARGGGREWRATADADGRFRIEALPDGRYVLG